MSLKLKLTKLYFGKLPKKIKFRHLKEYTRLNALPNIINKQVKKFKEKNPNKIKNSPIKLLVPGTEEFTIKKIKLYVNNKG